MIILFDPRYFKSTLSQYSNVSINLKLFSIFFYNTFDLTYLFMHLWNIILIRLYYITDVIFSLNVEVCSYFLSTLNMKCNMYVTVAAMYISFSTANLSCNLYLRAERLQVHLNWSKLGYASCAWDPEVYIRHGELYIPSNSCKTLGTICS